MCVYVFMNLCVHICVFVSLYVYSYIPMCVCMCIHACVFLYVYATLELDKQASLADQQTPEICLSLPPRCLNVNHSLSCLISFLKTKFRESNLGSSFSTASLILMELLSKRQELFGVIMG